jgi:hypothetical protein
MPDSIDLPATTSHPTCHGPGGEREGGATVSEYLEERADEISKHYLVINLKDTTRHSFAESPL